MKGKKAVKKEGAKSQDAGKNIGMADGGVDLKTGYRSQKITDSGLGKPERVQEVEQVKIAAKD